MPSGPTGGDDHSLHSLRIRSILLRDLSVARSTKDGLVDCCPLISLLSSARLLEKSNSDNDDVGPESQYGDKKLRKSSSKWFPVHICTLLVYTIVFISALTRTHVLLGAKTFPSSQNPLDISYCTLSLKVSFAVLAEIYLAPIRDAIRYFARTQHNSESETSIYRGPPSKEVKKCGCHYLRLRL